MPLSGDELNKFIGARIRAARESAGLSRPELARVLEWKGKKDDHQLYLIEAGRSGVSMARLWAIADGLGVPAHALIDPDVQFVKE